MKFSDFIKKVDAKTINRQRPTPIINEPPYSKEEKKQDEILHNDPLRELDSAEYWKKYYAPLPKEDDEKKDNGKKFDEYEPKKYIKNIIVLCTKYLYENNLSALETLSNLLDKTKTSDDPKLDKIKILIESDPNLKNLIPSIQREHDEIYGTKEDEEKYAKAIKLIEPLLHKEYESDDKSKFKTYTTKDIQDAYDTIEKHNSNSKRNNYESNVIKNLREKLKELIKNSPEENETETEEEKKEIEKKVKYQQFAEPMRWFNMAKTIMTVYLDEQIKIDSHLFDVIENIKKYNYDASDSDEPNYKRLINDILYAYKTEIIKLNSNFEKIINRNDINQDIIDRFEFIEKYNNAVKMYRNYIENLKSGAEDPNKSTLDRQVYSSLYNKETKEESILKGNEEDFRYVPPKKYQTIISDKDNIEIIPTKTFVSLILNDVMKIKTVRKDVDNDLLIKILENLKTGILNDAINIKNGTNSNVAMSGFDLPILGSVSLTMSKQTKNSIGPKKSSAKILEEIENVKKNDPTNTKKLSELEDELSQAITIETFDENDDIDDIDGIVSAVNVNAYPTTEDAIIDIESKNNKLFCDLILNINNSMSENIQEEYLKKLK